MLDPFWEQKGYITPERFRRFCDETVPLARLPKRIWTSDETFHAAIEVAHFGVKDRNAQPAKWRIRSPSGKTLAQGELPATTLRTGGVTQIGTLQLSLARFKNPADLNLEVELPGTRFANDWNFWVYPAQVQATTPDALIVSTELDSATLRALESGKRVALFPDPRRIRSKTVGRFDPIFWNKLWFPTQPQHTLGLLMDPDHRAFQQFPTAFHADWQWQDLQNESRPVVLDDFPKEYRPIVQVIDDWNSCRKLGLVFEARVGNGRLLVCSIDLNRNLQERPAARQLRASLLAYAAGEHFDPKTRIELAQVQALFRDLTTMEKLGAKVVRADSAERGYAAEQILDGDAATFWHTPWGDKAKGFPHEVVIGFDRRVKLQGLTLLPRQDDNPNGWIKDYAVYTSDDGKAWGQPIARGVLSADKSEKELVFPKTVEAGFLKFVALTSFDDRQPYASLAELRVVTAKP